MKSGTYKIKLPNNVAETLKANDGEKILDKNFQSAWDALSLDRVDMFFIDVSKINLNIQKRTYGDNVAYSLEINPIDSGGYLENGLTDEISVNCGSRAFETSDLEIQCFPRDNTRETI